MRTNPNICGFMLLECLIALACVAIALSLLLTLHVKSLHHQKILQAQTWALIHATSARHIQQHYTHSAHQHWRDSLKNTLPAPDARIDWHPQEAMQLCWEGSACWVLE